MKTKFTFFKPLAFLPALIFANKLSFCQTSGASTVPLVATGFTKPSIPDSSKGVNPEVLTICNTPNIQVHPSTIAQSEEYLTINMQNTSDILLSANTYPIQGNNSDQGIYVSTNGGGTWAGNDILPNKSLIGS